MRAANLAVRFLLELCALAALAYWGIETGSSVGVDLVLALGAVVAFAAIWGAWVAPRASRRLADPARLVLELALFAAAIAALAAAGRPVLAVAFAAVLAANETLGFSWGQREIA
jgi:hypothetical protein